MGITDFWWLTPDEAKEYKFVLVGHNEPYSDEPNPDRDPLSTPWYHSVDQNGEPAKNKRHYPLAYLNKWRKRFGNTNVFRSLALYTTQTGNKVEGLLGPLVVDIDREEYVDGKGYLQNIGDAFTDTQKVVQYLQKHYRVNESDIRVMFTGHKGFNVEVCPHALGIICIHNRRKEFEAKLNELNRALDSSSHRFVDRLHEYIRLHNSINKWIDRDGREVARMKYELSLDELFKIDAETVCKRAEELAKRV